MTQPATQQRSNDYLGLVVAGYVMAFVLPIGGLITGFAICEKRTGHAVVMLMLSVFTGAFYALWLLG